MYDICLTESWFPAQPDVEIREITLGGLLREIAAGAWRSRGTGRGAAGRQHREVLDLCRVAGRQRAAGPRAFDAVRSGRAGGGLVAQQSGMGAGGICLRAGSRP